MNNENFIILEKLCGKKGKNSKTNAKNAIAIKYTGNMAVSICHFPGLFICFDK